MNQKETAELRRHFHPDRTNITVFYGCYINDKREILKRFSVPLSTLAEQESEALLKNLQKTLSGKIEKDLSQLSFSNEQVLNGAAYQNLSTLRSSGCMDEAARETLYQKIAESTQIDGSYVVLLVCDTYDVFTHGKRAKDGEDSSEQFKYITAAICPLKNGKPHLAFSAFDNTFKNCVENAVISTPVFGFTFPCFDDRKSNIYAALCYRKDNGNGYEELIRSLFDTDAPMPVAEQQETFCRLLGDTVSHSCDLGVMQALHANVSTWIEEHRQSHDPEPLLIAKDALEDVLRSCDVPAEQIASFGTEYNESFGIGAAVSPGNIVDPRRFELETPDVCIRVNPQRPDLVSTQIIDGAKYILVRADSGVTVNGVTIYIDPKAGDNSSH